jgi:hypothetical protein
MNETRAVPKPLCSRGQGTAMVGVGFAVALLSLAPLCARADQVEMQNGDRYVGNVISLSAETLVLQNEVLGTVQLPRSKVAHIRLGTGPMAGAAALPSPPNDKARAPSTARVAAATNSPPALHQLGAHTNLIHQVQKQFLAGAGPEANQKFDELLNGLMSGKLNMDDLRAQAQSAADQLRAMKREGGQDPGLATDTYLTILDHFLKETAPSSSATNAPAP